MLNNILSLFISFHLSLSLCLSLSQGRVNDWNHLSELILFALAMQETLREINRFSSKNFQLRVGKTIREVLQHQNWVVFSDLGFMPVDSYSRR